MRKLVFQMMSTLNGRLDDPVAWLHEVSEEQYRDIDALYATYDTVLVGRTTYGEMAAYWPTALAETEGTETNRRMARRMRDYRKLVFSRSGGSPLAPWNNVGQVVAPDDAGLRKFLEDLKRQPGGDIHLSGGASFAASVIALGLVDAFHFFVYPSFSPGKTWYAHLPEKRDLKLVNATPYANGVVWMHYLPREAVASAKIDSFSDLLT